MAKPGLGIDDRQPRRWLRCSRLIQILCIVLLGVAIATTTPSFLWARPVPLSVPLSRVEQVTPGIHPLPPSLVRWQSAQQTGDYFDQIQPVSVGYLVWSQFPIKVFVEPLGALTPGSFESRRARAWINAMQAAIAEWNVYLPLQQISQADEANITIWRQTPPLRLETTKTGLQVPRARTAETRFELYNEPGPEPNLAVRFTIQIRPNQPDLYTLATARHELGHALGLWGHSTQPSDALYFAQVRQPPPISDRDVNTLKRIYQQPTRLGWRDLTLLR